MWSDKTTWLIESFLEAKKAMAFKPKIDTRYTKQAVLRSHSGHEVSAQMVNQAKPDEILKAVAKQIEVTRVLIDETNFFDQKLVAVVQQLVQKGIEVFAAGLLLDSERREFGATRKLTTIADEVVDGFAKCDFFSTSGRCQNPASLTYAKYKKETQLVVGAADFYGASCEKHYDLLYGNGEAHWSWLSRIKKTVWKKYIQPGDWDWLKKLQLPYERRVELRQLRQWPRIEIGADSMRVGKTTAVKVLAEQLKAKGLAVKVSFEDWQHNPYLKKSYSNPSAGLLKSQKWFIKRKAEQIKKGSPKNIFIQDVHPEMDFGYALTNVLMGRMDKDDFIKYQQYYAQFDWRSLAAPDLLVYLTISDEELIKRAKRTARKFEVVDEKYFLLMKAVNRTWILGADSIKILMIDTDAFDFAKDKNCQLELGERVIKSLKHSGWKL